MDYNEKCKYARAFVVLLAALIALLLNMKYKRDLVESLVIIIIVIIVFYIISSFALFLVEKIRNMDSSVEYLDNPDEEETDEDDNDNDEE